MHPHLHLAVVSGECGASAPALAPLGASPLATCQICQICHWVCHLSPASLHEIIMRCQCHILKNHQTTLNYPIPSPNDRFGLLLPPRWCRLQPQRGGLGENPGRRCQISGAARWICAGRLAGPLGRKVTDTAFKNVMSDEE